jgi:sensor histidine kinase YesM
MKLVEPMQIQGSRGSEPLKNPQREAKVFWGSFVVYYGALFSIGFLITFFLDRPGNLWIISLENYTIYFLAAYVVRFLTLRLRTRSFFLLLLSIVMVCFAFVGIELLLDLAIYQAIGSGFSASSRQVYIFSTGFREVPFLLSWAAIYLSLVENLVVQAQKLDLAKARSLAHQAQLKMLRYQLNPHFLFNTLNAMSSLVLDDKKEDAEGMILRLSRFLRYSLDRDPSKQITLDKELEAQQLYLEIEEVRFGEKLKTRFDIDPDVRAAMVPSMILQPLIENSIKYAIAPSATGGEIVIKACLEDGNLVMVVADTGPGAKNPKKLTRAGNGVGLANIAERLHVLYGDKGSIMAENRVDGGLRVRLSLPYETSNERMELSDEENTAG